MGNVELTPEAYAVVASNLVAAAATLHAAGKSEEEIRAFVTANYRRYRDGLESGSIYHEGAPI